MARKTSPLLRACAALLVAAGIFGGFACTPDYCASARTYFNDLRTRAGPADWLTPRGGETAAPPWLFKKGQPLPERPKSLVELGPDGRAWLGDSELDWRNPESLALAQKAVAGLDPLYVIASSQASALSLARVVLLRPGKHSVRLVGWLPRPTSEYVKTSSLSPWGKEWLARIKERDDKGAGVELLADLIDDGLQETAGGCNDGIRAALDRLRGGGDRQMVLNEIDKGLRGCSCAKARGEDLALVLQVLLEPMVPGYGWVEMKLETLEAAGPTAVVQLLPL